MEELTIDVWRDPYCAGFTPTNPKQITFNPGLTVLVGCNGAGKSTLILNIKEHCKENKIPYYSYDNLRDGGDRVLHSALAGFSSFENDLSFGATMFCSSEGETIRGNIGRQTKFYKEFEDTGKIKGKNPFERLMCENIEDEDEEITDNRRIYLFDAIDSGLSIDCVVDIKDLFKAMIKRNKEKGLVPFIIAVANEYELASGEACFDVNAGKYISFSCYEDYRSFVLESRKNKENRIKQQEIWYEKQAAKELAEYEKQKAKLIKEREAYIQEQKDKNEKIRWFELHHFSSKLNDLKRNVRYAKIEDDFKFDDNEFEE